MPVYWTSCWESSSERSRPNTLYASAKEVDPLSTQSDTSSVTETLEDNLEESLSLTGDWTQNFQLLSGGSKWVREAEMKPRKEKCFMA